MKDERWKMKNKRGSLVLSCDTDGTCLFWDSMACDLHPLIDLQGWSLFYSYSLIQVILLFTSFHWFPSLGNETYFLPSREGNWDDKPWGDKFASINDFASIVRDGDVLLKVKARLDIDWDNGRTRTENLSEQIDASFDASGCCHGKDIFDWSSYRHGAFHSDAIVQRPWQRRQSKHR